MARNKAQVYLDYRIEKALEELKEENEIENISQAINYALSIYFGFSQGKPKDFKRLVSKFEFDDRLERQQKDIDSLRDTVIELLEITKNQSQELQLLKDSQATTKVETTEKPMTTTKRQSTTTRTRQPSTRKNSKDVSVVVPEL